VAKPDAAKVLVWTVVLGIAGALGLVLLVHKITQSSRDKALEAVNAESKPPAARSETALLDEAAAVASPFIADVAAGRYAEAYARLAAPYRDVVTRGAFAKTCAASPLLSAARSVRLNHLRQQSAGAAATIEASGVLDTAAGAVPIGFVFLSEGGRLRILVVSLAGVPVLQGVAPR